MAKSIKKRNWTFLLYPESAPPDWLRILQDKGLSGAVSPLHDKDFNEADNTPKKAHYHIILCFSGPTTYNVVKSICDELNCPIPKPIESVKGLYRYLTHKDNPEKAQYSDTDIIEFGGFCYRDYCDMTRSEVLQNIKIIHILIKENKIVEYSELLDFLLDNDLSDLYDVATSHTILFGKYLDSVRNRLSKKSNNKEMSD